MRLGVAEPHIAIGIGAVAATVKSAPTEDALHRQSLRLWPSAQRGIWLAACRNAARLSDKREDV